MSDNDNGSPFPIVAYFLFGGLLVIILSANSAYEKYLENDKKIIELETKLLICEESK